MKNLKSDCRLPIAERNPNAEIEKVAACLNFSDFGFRISGMQPEVMS
jgi:hypothetical protein